MSPIKTIATTVPLLAVPNKKPVDLGCGRLSASVSADGQIISLNGFHPKVGFVTLAPIEQFPGNQFYNTPFVRQYRRRLVELSEQTKHGFGLRARGNVRKKILHLLEKTVPLFRYHLDTLEVSSLFLAGGGVGYCHLINQVEIYNDSDATTIFPYEFGGTFSLNRCSYGQLTEAGPIPMPPLENALKARENHLSIVNRHLPATTNIFLFDSGKPLPLSAAQDTFAKPINYTHRGEIRLEKGERRILTIVYILVPSAEEPLAISASEVEGWVREAKDVAPAMEILGRRNSGIYRAAQYRLYPLLLCCTCCG